ncbi:hypothetical protein DH2020_041293 [Rehmannia glutinosa]|uniref:Wall-associated receptor kinase-like protein n=1 Tax=Rehmannia glutinosa TaxID=99300 RepID=A0ABR0UQT3_REHGL
MLVSTRDDFRLIDISESQIRIRIPFFASRCYGNTSISSLNLTLDFSETPYTLSESNRLTQIGCSDLAVVKAFSAVRRSNLTQNNFASGCVSFCSDGDLSLNGSCRETVLPDSSAERDFSDLYRPPMTITNWMENVAVVLDWRIGTESCSQAPNSVGFGCYQNSDCIDADAGVGGYRCSCRKGYQGNPYLPPGCQDIDECESDPCHSTGICINTPGEYICGCPAGYYGNGWRNSTGCLRRRLARLKLSKLSIGLISGMGVITLLSISFGLIKFVKKKNNKKRKQKYFKQNGGLLLQQQSSVKDGILGNTRIFTAKELEKATDRFNESRILGRGGQGTVYKGMLSDGQIVAIKKSQLVDERKSNHLVEQFINEVVILSQINHRNVVKLLGCCLETKVPLLVYEFMANGTLFHHIHDENNNNTEFPFSWNMRLKIAAEIAGALAYLHSATSLPIFHRDVKSSNILLDEKYVAKVSDFGTSKSVAVDQTHLTTNVNGTFGQVLSAQGEKEGVLAVAKLAKRCLNLNGKKRPNMKEVSMELEALRMAQLGSSTARAELQEDSSFRNEGSVIFQTDDYDYSWTNTSDFRTNSSSDVYPIMFDTD